MNKVILTFLACATFAACTQPTTESQKATEKPQQTAGLIELTTFKLNKGVASADFAKAADQMQKDFLANQNGFIKRTLTNSGDTLWTDIVYWESEEKQRTAMGLAEKSAEVLPFMEKIDFNSVKMSLTKPVLTSE
jgi:ABC-type glycerol-3-phosphate transport system substrate-binding protein